LRFLDAGESHGPGITTIIEGVPYGLPLSAQEIEKELSRRRLGYGRGPRMALEKDEVEIVGGVRLGLTLGSPLALLVRNTEFASWKEIMGQEGKAKEGIEKLTRPRPGHADLPGAIKYGTKDIRDILERASARATVGRVCAGAVAKKLLSSLDVQVYSHVLSVGPVRVEEAGEVPTIEELRRVDRDPLRCLEPLLSQRMREEIDMAREQGDSLGGVFEVIAFGLPAGLGSHVQWDRRLDGRLAAAVMSIPAVKGVEVGGGFSLAAMRGSEASDDIIHRPEKGFCRRSNHGGGLEGGITNGEALILRAAMKPIPTMVTPRPSVDLLNKEEVTATVERADVCAVPAAAVIAEAAVAFELAKAFLEKLGGDSMEEIKARHRAMLERQRQF